MTDNWSVGITRLQKNPDAYDKFVLRQMVYFGLRGQKLSVQKLKKYWSSSAKDTQTKKVDLNHGFIV